MAMKKYSTQPQSFRIEDILTDIVSSHTQETSFGEYFPFVVDTFSMF